MKIDHDMGVIYLQKNINPQEFGMDEVRKAIHNTNSFVRCDYCNIETVYGPEEVTVLFKPVHWSERSSMDVDYSKVVFKES